MNATEASYRDELRLRLEQANNELRSLALETGSEQERLRIIGKSQGISLALEWMREYT